MTASGHLNGRHWAVFRGRRQTFEIPGLTLPPRWQMISALEAVNGALLFGISTAFLFAVIQVHWQLLSHRRERVE